VLGEVDAVLHDVVGGDADLGADGGELLGGGAEEVADGVPIVAHKGGDVELEGFVVKGDAGVSGVAQDVGGVAEDVAVAECGPFGADGDDPDVLGHCWGSFWTA